MMSTETELDKIIRTLNRRMDELENRISRMEFYIEKVPTWLELTVTSEQVLSNPKWLSQIELLRERVFDLDVRLYAIEKIHPEASLIPNEVLHG